MAGDEEPSKNPFIRWKQHVDSHISTTLQGIVGLPSAVSRNFNLRSWPEVEEARRKELEKQQQQQEEDNQRQFPSSSANESQQQAAAEPKPASSPSTAANPAPTGWTVSVFSPQDRDHCRRVHSGHSDFCPRSGAGSSQTPPGTGNPNDPNNWTAWPDWVQQARWHSFAAYSPYSPLNLRNLPQPRPLDLAPGEQSSFTFEDAFEDLLAVMCERELTPIKEKAEMRRVLRNMFPTGEPAFYWVRRLQSQGLLSGYFPRADQVRKQLEERFEAESEEEKQRQRELNERRGRMWKWVWSRHHPVGGEKKGQKNPDSSDAKSFEEWDPEDWVKEMDSILSQAAKDVRNELSNNGHIFGELERIFKAVGKVGEAFSGFGEDSSNKEQHEKQKPTVGNADAEEETEEDYFSTLAKASGSVSASTSTSTSTEPSSSLGTMTKIFNNHDGTTTTQTTSSDNNNRGKGPFHNTTTEESVDPVTGIRTVRTTEEKEDKKGNRTVRTEIRQLNSDGEEISRQTSYSKSMSASWSWSSGSSGSSGPDEDGNDGWSRRRNTEEKDGKAGWFWK